MDKEFVGYTEALALKKLGFDEPCFGYYDIQRKMLDTVSSEVCERLCKNDTFFKSPTYSQAFRWFRDNHSLVHRIDKEGGWWVCAILNLYDEKEQGTIEIYLENSYPNTYEEAELACLKKLIEIVKESKS